MVRIDRVILLAALAVLIGCYSLWPRLWGGAFYHCVAVGIFLLLICVRRLSKGDEFLHTVSTAGAWLAFNNILDEAFFDPRTFQINEYIVAAIVIFITCKRLWKTKRQKKPGRFY